jgi:hypothetical protein
MTSLQAWQHLAAHHPGWGQPVNRLCSADFKALGQEPRLMTKFDSRASRPEPLKAHDLFLLPEKNGEYLVLRAEGYCDLKWPRPEQIENVDARFPFALDSLRGAQSEMSHLDRLFLAGVIGDVVGVKARAEVLATIRGRRFAPPFGFRVGSLGAFRADRIQYEVDQGYETENEILLFEAKTTTPADFLIRQLFFPFKVFSAQSNKKIRPFFFNFNATSGVYSFFEYHFSDPNDLCSIEIKPASERHFRIHFDESRAPLSLGHWLARTPLPAQGASWEVPQADDFSKVMEFPLHVAGGCTDAGLIAGAFDFSPRQSSYYRRASEQMGLVCGYELTDAGRDFLSLSPREREGNLIRALLQQPVVRVAIESALGRADHRVCGRDIAASIRANSHIQGDTVARRALTVRSWLRWLQTTLGELRVGDVVLKVD